MQPCGKQRQDVRRRVQGRTGEANVFSAITVREPLSRFISGVRKTKIENRNPWCRECMNAAARLHRGEISLL